MFSVIKRKFVLAAEKNAVKKAVANVIESNISGSVFGRQCVKKLEILLSDKLGASVLGVGGGTDALVLVLKALGVGPGDEVIVPAFGCVAIASCVSWVGATPIFSDIRKNDFVLDPGGIAEKITPRTKAVIFAHFFGQPAKSIKDALSVTRTQGLFLIEDAAQVFGATSEIDGVWKSAGIIGDAGCFSFSSTKLFSVPGSAGAVVVNDARVKEKVDQMRLYGAKSPYYDHPVVGIGAGLDEIHAAILIAKLPFLDYWLERRRELAYIYTKTLSGVGDLILPREEEGTTRIWYRYVIRTKRRDALLKYLQTIFKSTPRLVPFVRYPVPLSCFSAFGSRHAKGDFPNAGDISSEVLCLPMYNAMSLEDLDKECGSIKDFFN